MRYARKQMLHKAGLWFSTAVALLALTGFTEAIELRASVSALAQERTLATGIADSTSAQGAKWRQIGFRAAQTGSATLRLSWTGAADLRFQLLNANKQVLGGNTTASIQSPKTYTRSLTANTQHYVNIWSYSGVGNFSMSITENFPDATDTTSPSTPTNLTSPAQSSSTVTLNWTAATDNIGVAGYRIYRDAVQLSTTSLSSFTDSGLQPATPYSYTVQAYDAAGNVSQPTSPLAITTAPEPAEGDRPNIIVINLDDMRTDSMADLPKVRQWMGDGGTFFPNGYVATPSCCPSRATLMTGRYVHNNGQYNQNNAGTNLDLTVQRYLKDSGYFTGHAGKFLHWLNINTRAPHWDRWTYFKGGYENVQMNFDGVTRTSQGYSTTITFDRGIEYLRDFEARDDSKPFYVQLTPVAPHSPSTPEPKYATAPVSQLTRTPSHDETDRTDKPAFVGYTKETYEQGNARKTVMTRALLTVDDQVDRLMNELGALNELDNTMVIFTADNGYFFGEHGRGSKFLPYKESVEVPFYIRWPGKVQSGAVDARRVSHIDITPTILAAANVTQNHVELDGKDILSGYVRPQAYSEYYYDSANANYITTWSSIRTDEYLYVEYYDTTTTRGAVSFREYYDMVNDPYQMQNILRDNNTANDPDVNALSAILVSHRDCSGLTCK